MRQEDFKITPGFTSLQTEVHRTSNSGQRKVLSELSLCRHDQQIGGRLWTGKHICKWDQENWDPDKKNLQS